MTRSDHPGVQQLLDYVLYFFFLKIRVPIGLDRNGLGSCLQHNGMVLGSCGRKAFGLLKDPFKLMQNSRYWAGYRGLLVWP